MSGDGRGVIEANPDIGKMLEATGMLVDIRNPSDFGKGIAEIRGKLGTIAQALGMKAAQPER